MPFRELRLLCLLIVLVPCLTFGQTQSVSETGLEGTIRISPAHPGPIKVGEPSSGPFANATFIVSNQNGKVVSLTTDDQGRFRISLTPGHYTVAVENNEQRIRRCGPFDVDVAPGQITKVEWGCDSGMR